MIEKKATLPTSDPKREALAIREELAFIGRTMDRIAPTTSLYKKLVAKKEELRRELKKYPKKEYSFIHRRK